jgi:hypothetical protein
MLYDIVRGYLGLKFGKKVKPSESKCCISFIAENNQIRIQRVCSTLFSQVNRAGNHLKMLTGTLRSGHLVRVAHPWVFVLPQAFI